MLRLILIPLFLFFLQPCVEAQIIVGIGGGTGSGKTTLAENLNKYFGAGSVLIQQDSYYKDWSHLSVAERAKLNFDHPESIDFPLMREQLLALKRNESILVPKYDFVTHSRRKDKQTVYPKKLIIVEGILVLAIPELRDLFDIKIYIDTNDDIRILRRMERDLKERGRTFDSVKDQYLTTVKPMHGAFVEPSKQHADVVVHGVNDNFDAVVNLISGAISRSQ